MLEELFRMLPCIQELAKEPGKWEALLINKRKPHTYRLFTQVGDNRVCLHKFDACSSNEAGRHPHPWPGAFLVLHGTYRMWTGRSPDRGSPPVDGPEFLLTAGSAYQITSPLDWHSVTPLEETWTVMVNGPRWPDDVRHEGAPTTAGKGLKAISNLDKVMMLPAFAGLIGQQLACMESF